MIDAGIGLNEYCVSCSAGYIDGNNVPLLDLNYMEKNATQNYQNKSFKSQKQITTKARYGKNDQKTSNQQMREKMIIKKKDKDKDKKDDTSYCSGQLTLAIMPISNKIITMQMQSIIDIDKMEKLLEVCQKGCKAIHKTMKNTVKQHSFELMQHRGFINR